MKLVLKRLLPALFVLTVLFQVILPQVSAVGVAPAKNEVDDEALPEVEESLAGAGLLFLIALLMIAFMVGYVLREIKFAYLHESGAAMIIGLVAGLLVRTLNNTSTLKSVVAFDKHFFFLVLLPPIIFESGYNMRRGHFFYNVDSILFFALVGTVVSMFLTGFLLYFFSGILGWTYHSLPLIDCMLIGAILSATDPVTVLALFTELGVTPSLYANVFGESVLNDAVAIVLYETVKEFLFEPLTVGSLLLGVWNFIKILVGSVLVALIVSALCALLFKHTNLRKYPMSESALLILYAYVCYLISQDLELSGIVSILFGGIFFSHFAFPNLSHEAQHITHKVFEIIPKVFETFVFVYLGMILFTLEQNYDWGIILFTLPILLLARAAHIFPGAILINKFRSEDHKIPMGEQFMMWFAGLRGAIAVALSLQVPSINGSIILSNTLMIVFFTVLVFGGLTIPMLNWWNVPIGLKDVQDIDTEEIAFLRDNLWRRLDRKYLRGFLTVPESERDKGPEHGHGGHGNGNGHDGHSAELTSVSVVKSPMKKKIADAVQNPSRTVSRISSDSEGFDYGDLTPQEIAAQRAADQDLQGLDDYQEGEQWAGGDPVEQAYNYDQEYSETPVVATQANTSADIPVSIGPVVGAKDDEEIELT